MDKGVEQDKGSRDVSPLTQPRPPPTRRTSEEYGPEWQRIKQCYDSNKYFKMYQVKFGVQGNVIRDVSQLLTGRKTEMLPPQPGKIISRPVGP